MSLTLTKTAITKLNPYFELFQKLCSRLFITSLIFGLGLRARAEAYSAYSSSRRKLSRCRQRVLIRIKRLQNQLIRRIRHRISKSRFQRWSRHRKFLHQLVNLFALKLFLHSVFHREIRLKPFPASFYVVLATSQNYRWV